MIIDSAVADFRNQDTATTHAARLTLSFNYERQTDVSSDLRYEFFAPLFSRFDGKLTYIDPASYPGFGGIEELNIHPTGMTLAWEGEYTFAARTSIAELANAVRETFGCTLKHGRPTQLPVRELSSVPCRFALMPRYY